MTQKKSTAEIFAAALGIFLALLTLTSFCPVVFAEEPEQKIVRVGYVNSLNYEEGKEGEYKRGSGYEYLQQISYLTGWKYEYVYGSFKDCYEMLANGEIDLFGNVSYTPERAEQINFSSYPQGKDVYLLYTTKDRAALLGGDMERLNGCKIGVTGSSYQEGLLKRWLEENKINAEVVERNGYDALMSALDSGEFDAIVTPDLSISYDYVSIMDIGFSEYYFAVSKSRPDILQELNEALYEIQNTEQDYNSQLVSRYYNRMTSALMLNEKESEWITDRKNTLRLGYISDDLPFCAEQDGKLVGVMQTVTETIEREFGIHVQTVAYPDIRQMRQALKDGEIDIAGPVIRDFYLAEQDDCVLTSAMLESTPVIVYKGDDVGSSLKTIATTDASVFESSYIKVLFPDAEIYQCSSRADCMQAVADGKAGSTLILSARLNIVRSNDVMENLSFAEMARRLDICFVTTKANRRAATIMNKGIKLSSDVLNGVVLSQHSVTKQRVSLKDFATQYAWGIIVLGGIIILVLGVLTYRLSVSQKKLVAALEEAESANRAKTTFLSNMSHDIRTPMNAIIGFTDIALKQKPSVPVQNCLEKIAQSSDHLLALINDVLDISRIESGKIKFDPVPIDITEIVDSVLSIMNGYLTNRDLDFQVTREPISHPYVLADAVRIREILVNILGNAVKFTEDGGSIQFHAEYRNGKDAQHIIVQYCISDTGIGMSKQFLAHIFDEFTQEDNGARTQYRGTGLGMAITKRYVDLMGGTITVQSEKDVGSTFIVEIPLELTEKKNALHNKAQNPNIDLTGLKVLMAEDNDLNAEIATVQLEEYGVVVTRAADGREAVERFANSPANTYDLILMDIMMPNMDGYAATQAIRSMTLHPDALTIPIIAMTANAFAEDVQASMAAGMNAHLSKPLNMEDVIKTITRTLNR